jgi:hypothetical protein
MNRFVPVLVVGFAIAGSASFSLSAQRRGQPLEQGAAPAPPRRPATLAGCPADPTPFYPCAKEKIKVFEPPRTADGKPNFEGFWNANRQAFNIEKHAADEAYQGGPTLVIDTPDGLVPFQPWAAAKKKERSEKTLNPPSIEWVDPNAQCFLRGVPRQMWMMDYQFVQPVGSPFMFTLHEQNHAYRTITLDERPHLDGKITTWMGDSRGHWEGNTLVVDVTNQNGREWLDNVGNFYTSAAHIVERFALVDNDTILYEARMDDPSVYTRPWTLSFPLTRNKTPDFQLMEFACQEGNRSPEMQMKPKLGK